MAMVKSITENLAVFIGASVAAIILLIGFIGSFCLCCGMTN
jgi:hypothetical protein